MGIWPPVGVLLGRLGPSCGSPGRSLSPFQGQPEWCRAELGPPTRKRRGGRKAGWRASSSRWSLASRHLRFQPGLLFLAPSSPRIPAWLDGGGEGLTQAQLMGTEEGEVVRRQTGLGHRGSWRWKWPGVGVGVGGSKTPLLAPSLFWGLESHHVQGLSPLRFKNPSLPC